jgi:thioredoxin 1
MSENELKELTDATFKNEVKHSHIPVVIDFWAPWCEPCKLVSPILSKLSEKYVDKVKFLKMNVDEEKTTPAEYAVHSIPTLLFFKQGKIANQMIGVHTEETIDQVIQSLF